MKVKWLLPMGFILLLLGSYLVAGPVVYLYVDAAPNKNGSPDYAGWEEAAFADVANGTFVNMANSANPDLVGTTNFDILDEVVYSFGDLGKRLTWIYWIPDQTIESVKNFQVSLFNNWGGEILDVYQDYYGSTWLTPTTWSDYDSDNDGSPDGVIGAAGMAWWGAYYTGTQEELDQDIADWIRVNETWTFSALLITPDEGGSLTWITSRRAAVPEPSILLLLCTGLAVIGLRKVSC
ncbi:MAG: PEP-CTERM sorting domain-containing protein [Acidobacteriota bacterium]|jgi:hypothetical protein